MAECLKKRSDKVGLPPGTVLHMGEEKGAESKITLIDYDESEFTERELDKAEECFEFRDKPTVTWINVDGIHRADIIEKIGKYFDFHPLILEDIVTTGQRPKLEDFGNYLYIVLKMLSYDEEEDKVNTEQVSLILGSNYVISFQETIGDVFDPVRERIRNGKGRIRKSGADHLAYSLIDAVVDNYFVILEKLGEKLEGLEEELVEDPRMATLNSIRHLRSEMIFLRKSVWPLRELVSGIQRGGSALISPATNIYLRDVYDHTIQVIDTIEAYRDILAAMVENYLSSINNKMNSIMKVLTIIATIFIPLTFIASIYGMNFEYLPEKDWRYGYPAVLLFMLAVSIVMLFYFKKKKWL